MCEILAVLYLGFLNIDVKNITSPARDRFILSKGHGALALYAALKQKGILTQSDLELFKKADSDFWTHPVFFPEKGFEFASGSLGQGLGLAAGTALAAKHKKLLSRVYVYLGDGECDEGAVWESASFASHQNLDNLTVIIDENKLQIDGLTKDVVNKDDLIKRWKAFGFDAIEADGHSIKDLVRAFSYKSYKPIAIIARTVKGKGVSFMENNPIYHSNSLTEKQFEMAMAEQE